MLEDSSSSDDLDSVRYERRKSQRRKYQTIEYNENKVSIIEPEILVKLGITNNNDASVKLVEFIRRKSFTYGEPKEKVPRLGDQIVLEEEKEMILKFLRAMKERRVATQA